MTWDDATRERLEAALNESEVVGVRLEPSRAYVDVLLQVIALPEAGQLMTDGRRIIRLIRPGELRFLLRPDRPGQASTVQPAIPLADLAAVEAFFEALTWGGAIYGWRFFDDPQLVSDWPADISLHVPVNSERVRHSFYWFNECGCSAGAYCLEGTITFDDVQILDAAGAEIPLESFVADGMRHWEALFAGDPRLSGDAQDQAQRDAPKWRAWAVRGP